MRNWIIGLLLIVLTLGCTWITLTPDTTTTTPQTGDAVRGQQIFKSGVNGAPPCLNCHKVGQGGFGFSIGPNLAGISQRAGTRVAGLTAEAYIRQSILDPHAYVVSSYRDIMYPDFRQHLSDQDVADLVAYLMTL